MLWLLCGGQTTSLGVSPCLSPCLRHGLFVVDCSLGDGPEESLVSAPHHFIEALVLTDIHAPVTHVSVDS